MAIDNTTMRGARPDRPVSVRRRNIDANDGPGPWRQQDLRCLERTQVHRPQRQVDRLRAERARIAAVPPEWIGGTEFVGPASGLPSREVVEQDLAAEPRGVGGRPAPQMVRLG